MILFRWDLTPAQVHLMRGLREWEDKDLEHSKDCVQMCPGIKNFVGGVKTLLRERLIYCVDVPVDHAERFRYTGKTRPKWGVTKKGRLLLDLVELEIRDQAAELGRLESPKPVKSLAKGKEKP